MLNKSVALLTNCVFPAQCSCQGFRYTHTIINRGGLFDMHARFVYVCVCVCVCVRAGRVCAE